mmetsp:Transcript_55884/g.132598  ORF Transcript_55884/g.132598 Transcript_55884/m.132598 type:complete len:205 (-) Transcript_55884:412-1026(-)
MSTSVVASSETLAISLTVRGTPPSSHATYTHATINLSLIRSPLPFASLQSSLARCAILEGRSRPHTLPHTLSTLAQCFRNDSSAAALLPRCWVLIRLATDPARASPRPPWAPAMLVARRWWVKSGFSASPARFGSPPAGLSMKERHSRCMLTTFSLCTSPQSEHTSSPARSSSIMLCPAHPAHFLRLTFLCMSTSHAPPRHSTF